MRIHTAWRAEYSQKCTPLPMGPVCGRREASRSFAERGLAHCLAGPGPCRRPLVLWKTPVLASGCVANVRRGAGRADFVRSRSLAKDLKISVLTTTRAYNELEEEGFITSRQGKGFFVMSSGSNLIREQLIQEVEKNLNSAILAAERASMTDEELIKLLRLLLEVNHE